jgi:hypothetical protein
MAERLCRIREAAEARRGEDDLLFLWLVMKIEGGTALGLTFKGEAKSSMAQ